MKPTTKNIIGFLLGSILICAIFIPIGMKEGWPSWKIVSTIMLICLAVGIASGKSNPQVRTTSCPALKNTALNFLSYSLIVFGSMFMFSTHLESLWWYILGAAMLLSSAFMKRYI